MNIQETVDDVVGRTPGVDWSILIGGRAARRPRLRLRTASVGKLLLLIETARRIGDGRLDPFREGCYRDLVRMAMYFGATREVAQDAVQETLIWSPNAGGGSTIRRPTLVAP